MSEAQTFSWRQARELLQESGHGANEAQDVLEDMIRWPNRSFSVRTEDGVRWLQYAGSGSGQPEWQLFTPREPGKTPPPRDGLPRGEKEISGERKIR